MTGALQAVQGHVELVMWQAVLMFHHVMSNHIAVFMFHHVMSNHIALFMFHHELSEYQITFTPHCHRVPTCGSPLIGSTHSLTPWRGSAN